MPRTSMPQNYTFDEGTLFEGFETLTDWTVQTNNSGTAISDPVVYKTGTQSIKLSIQSTESAKYVSISKTISKTISPKNLGLWVYLHTAQATFGQMIITISSTTNFSKYFRFYIPYSPSAGTIVRVIDGWNFFPMHRDDMTVYGGESWSNTMITLKIEFSSSATNLGQISIDNMVYDYVMEPRLMFTFDGFRQSIHDTAYPIMAAADIPGTVFMVANWVGQGGAIPYATLAMAQTLRDAGWSVCNHTDDHTDLSTASLADATQHIKTGKEWLVANGFSSTKDYLAYPNGTWSDTAVQAATDCDVKAARTTSNALHFRANPLLIKVFNIVTSTTLANVKTMIDYTIKYGGTICFYFDGVYSVAPLDTLEWSLANFQGLINYIVACKIKCVTIDEWYNGLTNYKYKSVPITRSTLSQNYRTQSSTELTDFSALTNWSTPTYGSIELNTDTTYVENGSDSIHMNYEGDGSHSCSSIKTVNLDMSSMENVDLWFYVKTVPYYVYWGFYTVAYSNYFHYELAPSHVKLGWNHIIVHKDQFYTYGSGKTWEDAIVKINYKLDTTDATYHDGDVYFDYVGTNIKTNPNILFTFDDGLSSVVTNALPILNAATNAVHQNGIPATMYMIGNKIGTSGRLTLAELLTLQNTYNWCIGNHTYTHEDLTSLSITNAKKIIQDNIDYYRKNGLNGYNHFAYPFGSYNDDIQQLLSDMGILTARSIVDELEYFPIANPYVLASINLYPSLTLANAKAAVDKAILTGGTLIFYGHNILDSDPGGSTTHWLTADFQSLVDYINSLLIECITIEQLYIGQLNPRIIRERS